jgi:hypothetical protein
MSGTDHEDDPTPAPAAPGRQEDPGDANAEEDLGKLLAALRAAAKEDDLAVARLPSDAFASLSADVRTRIADRIGQAQAAETEREKPTAGNVVVSMDGRRRRSRRLLAVVLAPLAAAAAVVLMVRSFPGQSLVPLPEYGISANGGIKELRGTDPASSQAAGMVAAPQRLRPESHLVAIARPDVAVEGPVAVRVFVVQGAKAEEVRPQVRIAPSGAVEVRAAVAEVFGDRRGHWDMVVLVARSEALRKVEPAVALATPPAATWRRLTVPLDFDTP